MRLSAPLRAALAATLVAGPAAASSVPGAWQTFMHAGEFTALLGANDAVWGATAEAGLFRWDRAAGRFDQVRREPGTIASNLLTGLALDRSGRLWVATAGAGVSRRSADGKHWDLVNRLDGLPTDTVQVLEATGDTLWIGTSQGIALWNGREIAGSLPDGVTLSFDTTFASTSVTGVVLHGDSLWISTRRGIGLARISSLLADWRPVNQGLPATDIASLASDGAAVFAQVGTDAYRWRADLAQWQFEPGAGIVHRLTDAAGTILAAGESGAFRWVQTATDSGWVALPGAPVASPAAASDPEITLAPDGVAFAAVAETLFEAPAAAGAWASHPLPGDPPGNDLLQVALDGRRIYVTTNTSGIARYDGSWRTWLPGACAGAQCDTTFINPMFALGMLVDRTGRKWVGCWSQAFDSFLDDGVDPRFTHHAIGVDIPSQQRTWIFCGAQDSIGWRWFGTDTPLKGDVDPIGLEIYDDTLGYRGNLDVSNSQMSGKFVRGLTVTPNGRLWVGYDPGGVDVVSGPPDSVHFTHMSSTAGLSVRGLACYGESLWVATNTELWRFNEAAFASVNPVQKLPLRGGLAALGVKPIATGPDGAVWVATGEGLRVFRPGGAIDSFTTANSPIPGDEVRAVAVDPVSGAVWMTTAAGLARLDPAYVPPPAPPLPSLTARVYPNPALLTGLGIQLRIDGGAESYSGAVYDLSGRRIRRIRDVSNGAVVWDGRDDAGKLVSPGVYFVRVEAGGRAAVARVALIQ